MGVVGGAAVAAAVSAYVGDRADDYAHLVATADWHIDPGGHWSDEPDFRDSWPVHCEVGTAGADFHAGLAGALERVDMVFRKGEYDAAYSGFEGATEDGTRLTGWLREHGVAEVDVVGIATDHCVRATALDAVKDGFRTRVLLDLTAGVAEETVAAARDEMHTAGIELVEAP